MVFTLFVKQEDMRSGGNLCFLLISCPLVYNSRAASSPIASESSHNYSFLRPNRSYRIGTTIMFSAVELERPHMITIAMGA